MASKAVVFTEDQGKRILRMLYEFERSVDRGKQNAGLPGISLGSKIEVAKYWIGGGTDTNEGRQTVLPGNRTYQCRKARWFEEGDYGRFIPIPGSEIDVRASLLTGAYTAEHNIPITKIKGQYYALGGFGIRVQLRSALVQGGSATAWVGTDSTQVITVRDSFVFVTGSATSIPVGTYGYAVLDWNGLYGPDSSSEFFDWALINASCV